MAGFTFDQAFTRGTFAARPAANTLPLGALYYDTTNKKVYKGAGLANTWADWTDAFLTAIAAGSISTTELAARAATFAKIQAIATGKLLGRSTAGSGDIEELTVGSGLSLAAGTLTASGGGGSGALSFRQRLVASASASLDFNSWYSASYDNYLVLLEDIVLSTPTDIWMRFGVGGVMDSSAIYGHDNHAWRAGGQGFAGTPASATKIHVTYPGAPCYTTAGRGVCGWLLVQHVKSTVNHKQVNGETRIFDNTFKAQIRCSGVYESLVAQNSMQFLPAAGTITSGAITILGYSNS